MHACATYYHQGSDLCADLEPFFKTLAEEAAVMRDETHQLTKELENRHAIVKHDEIVVSPANLNKSMNDSSSSILMEGYLFKRTSNAFKTWHRRWFYLYENKLLYRYGQNRIYT